MTPTTDASSTAGPEPRGSEPGLPGSGPGASGLVEKSGLVETSVLESGLHESGLLESGLLESGLLENRVEVGRTLRRLRRRVLAQRFLRNAAVDLAIFSAAAAALLLLDRLLYPGAARGALLALGAALALGASLLRTFLPVVISGRSSLLEVAMLADRKFELKERVASAVYVDELARAPAPRDWPDGVFQDRVFEDLRRLLLREAARSLKGVEIEKHFPLRVPRQAAWAVLLLLLNGVLALWLPSYDLLGIAERQSSREDVARLVEEKEQELARRLAELEKKAEEKKTPEAQKLLELLRNQSVNTNRTEGDQTAPSGERAGDKSPAEPQRQALVALSRREDQLKQGLGEKKFESLKTAVKSLKSLALADAKLTRKLQSALKEGDFAKAKEELTTMRKELEELSKKTPGELTEEEKERQRQLAEELSRLAKNASALAELSTQLSKAATGLSAGDFSEALEGMSMSGEELDSLAALANEMDILDQALELVRLSKEELSQISPQSCPQCGTPFCPDCGKPQCGCKPANKPGGT